MRVGKDHTPSSLPAVTRAYVGHLFDSSTISARLSPMLRSSWAGMRARSFNSMVPPLSLAALPSPSRTTSSEDSPVVQMLADDALNRGDVEIRRFLSGRPYRPSHASTMKGKPRNVDSRKTAMAWGERTLQDEWRAVTPTKQGVGLKISLARIASRAFKTQTGIAMPCASD